MPFRLQKPTIYLITSGQTSQATIPSSEDYQRIIRLIESAVAAGIDLIQIREKNLTDRTLYDLSVSAAKVVRGSSTYLLVNDRADIARAAGAHGVHLTTRSIPAAVIRQTFGQEFLLGVSTHSLAEAKAAQEDGADFAVFGPVFDTESKRIYGDPLGLEELRSVTKQLAGFPVLALGGITISNAAACFEAGASGVAAIRMLNNPELLASVVAGLR